MSFTCHSIWHKIVKLIWSYSKKFQANWLQNGCGSLKKSSRGLSLNTITLPLQALINCLGDISNLLSITSVRVVNGKLGFIFLFFLFYFSISFSWTEMKKIRCDVTDQSQSQWVTHSHNAMEQHGKF